MLVKMTGSGLRASMYKIINNGRMIKLKILECICTPMEINMKANGKMDVDMEKESSFGPMVISMKVNIN